MGSWDGGFPEDELASGDVGIIFSDLQEAKFCRQANVNISYPSLTMHSRSKEKQTDFSALRKLPDQSVCRQLRCSIPPTRDNSS